MPLLSQACNSGTRIKVIFFLVISILHFLSIGYVLEHGISLPPLLAAARSAGGVAALDLSFVSLSFLFPFASTLSKSFSIGILQQETMTSTPKKLFFHRNMALSAGFFSLVHIFMHTLTHFSPKSAFLSRFAHGIPHGLYSFNVPIITGIFMLVGFSVAFLTVIRTPVRPFTFFLHIPFACLGFVAFFVHGYSQLLGSPLGSQICVFVFIFSIAIFFLFFVVARIKTLQVDRTNTKIGTTYIYLVLKYPDSQYLPPGSFFNLFAISRSFASIFHCHSFPAFNTKNLAGKTTQIAFLIRRNEDPHSFTSKLAS